MHSETIIAAVPSPEEEFFVSVTMTQSDVSVLRTAGLRLRESDGLLDKKQPPRVSSSNNSKCDGAAQNSCYATRPTTENYAISLRLREILLGFLLTSQRI